MAKDDERIRRDTLFLVGEFPVSFGRYQLVDRLAMGGMAELFIATSPGEHGFQKKVVIKRLLPHLGAGAGSGA